MKSEFRRLTPILLLTLAFPCAAEVNVLTVNYDNRRTNANLRETTLNTSNVNSRQFGKLFALPVEGAIFAQPLYWSNVSIPGKGTRNVVYVATMHNDVYAFDADLPGDSLWHVNLGPAVPATAYNVEGTGDFGILSTPVIDPSTSTLYVVANTVEDGRYYYRLHALDAITGAERFGGPSVIQASAAGTNPFDSAGGIVNFVPFKHLQRPGLLLLNNTVYIAFGSHNDEGPFHGWLLGYNAGDVQQQVVAFNTTPNGWGGAIWQGARGPAADEQGNIYVATGNGAVDASDWGETILKFGASSGFSLMDWFTPDNWGGLNDEDADLGACGPVVAGENMLIGGGKQGVIYVLDRNQLGRSQPGNGQIPQNFQAIGLGIYNMAYWENSSGPLLYVRGFNDAIKAFRMSNGVFDAVPFSQSAMFPGIPRDGMALSANGSDPASGILWMAATSAEQYRGPGLLRAYAATDLSRELWNSGLNSERDQLGNPSKFAPLTVANGNVYVPTASNQLVVYGLLPAANARISGIVNAASGAAGPIAPGEIVSIYGAGLIPGGAGFAYADASGLLRTEIGGTRVLFGDEPGPLIYASTGQVTAIAPFSLAGQAETTVTVEYAAVKSRPLGVKIAAAAPGLFTLTQTGAGQGAILNQDGSVNSGSNPAARGSIVVFYGTGQGMSSPGLNEGQLSFAPYPRPVLPVSVIVGGQDARVFYAGAAPGFAGLMQVNARVPANISPGAAVPLTLKVGSATSQSGVTLAVQ